MLRFRYCHFRALQHSGQYTSVALINHPRPRSTVTISFLSVQDTGREYAHCEQVLM